LKLMVPGKQRLAINGVRTLEIVIFILLFFQLSYGALMAGHKAATAAPTWPDINGQILNPAGIVKPGLGALNLIENKIMIHVVHRGLAYLLLVLVILYSYRLSRYALTPLIKKTTWYPAIIVCIQVLLGIVTVLTSSYIMPGHWGSFEWMAQLHQFFGMCLLLVMVWMFYMTNGSTKAAKHI